MAFVFVCLAAAALLVSLLGQPHWKARRRRQWASRPFPALWHRLLKARWPLYQRLSPTVQRQLQSAILVFVAEKPFVGCAGLALAEEMRVLVAAQACLLLLGDGTGLHFDAIHRVLLYPDAFGVRRSSTELAGVVREWDDTLAGESWAEGQVILSWRDVVDSALHDADGYNVVLHEFAHQLDPGVDALEPSVVGRRWLQAYHDYVAVLERGEPCVLDPYAAEDPHEFFAVATESFFEQGVALREQQPSLYQLLFDYYRLDPAAWTTSG